MVYKLEKNIWSEEDFDIMGWHDSTIYQIRVTENIELDIDYIFKWNEPELKGLPFTFWVAPATLVFRQVKDLISQIDTVFDEPIEIADVEREYTDNGALWTIATQQGNIQFISDGYQQFIRQQPSLQFGQTISLIERNGHSLEHTTNQDNPNEDGIAEQRKKDLEHYEIVKKRHLKRQEMEKLNGQRENKKVETKEFLLKKRKINELIANYDSMLKHTRFESW